MAAWTATRTGVQLPSPPPSDVGRFPTGYDWQNKKIKASQRNPSRAINIIILINIALSFHFYEFPPPHQDRLSLRPPPCLPHPQRPPAATSSPDPKRKRSRCAQWLRYL